MSEINPAAEPVDDGAGGNSGRVTNPRDGVTTHERDDYCYVTTRGRYTGKPHEIEIWYAAEGDTLYVLAGAGAGADWVQNLRDNPDCFVRLDHRIHRASARVLGDGSDEDCLARRLVYEKYQPRYRGDLTEWRSRALPVALDIDPEVVAIADMSPRHGLASVHLDED